MAASGRINGGRVLLGGLLAGLTINVLRFAFHALMRREWEAAMSSTQTAAAQKPAAMAAHFGWSWVIAIGLVWLYAAIRSSLSLARDLLRTGLLLAPRPAPGAWIYREA